MKRISIIASSILIVCVVFLLTAFAAYRQQTNLGAYYDPENECNYYTFKKGDTKSKDEAKKNCESCAGHACKLVSDSYQSPACLGKCKNQ